MSAGNAERGDAQVLYVLVGTYAANVSVFKLDVSTCTLTFVKRFTAGSKPSFLVMNKAKTLLFAADEVDSHNGVDGTGGLLSFSYTDGQLTAVNTVNSAGAWPCHLSLDKPETHLLFTNYCGSNFGSFAVSTTGELSAEPTCLIKVQGSGPDAYRQDAPHPHSLAVDGSGAYAFVSDLGTDRVWQFTLASGVLTPNPAAAFVETGPGTGPRHLKFHPLNGSWAYGTNELSSTVSFYTFDSSTGTLKLNSHVSTLPAGKTIGTADTASHPQGALPSELQVAENYVYVLNRDPHNSIAIFAINQATGALTLKGTEPVHGTMPRHFVYIDEVDDRAAKRLLLVANQTSDNITMFSANAADGLLSFISSINIESPACILVAG